jgi:hypothetical protein
VSGSGAATVRPAAITGELSIELADGQVLTDATDLGLAWQWAAAEYGPEEWGKLSYGAQCAEVGSALAALRAAAQ